MSTLAETLLDSSRIAPIGKDGYITCQGNINIRSIVEGTNGEATRLYLEGEVTSDAVHLLVIALFNAFVAGTSYQVEHGVSQITSKPETVIIFQRVPTIATVGGH